MLMSDYVSPRGYEDRYESPAWWMRQGRSYDPRYEHARRVNGDWMHESPWMQPPWTPGPWAQGAWGQGPWLRETPWMWGRDGWSRDSWGREPWGREPLGRESAWVNGYEPMVKVIEVFAESPHSWEDATRRAIAEASQTVRGIRSIYIKDMQAVVEEDRVIGFRINAKISFTLDDNRRRR